jgi:hypothetical protein
MLRTGLETNAVTDVGGEFVCKVLVSGLIGDVARNGVVRSVRLGFLPAGRLHFHDFSCSPGAAAKKK